MGSVRGSLQQFGVIFGLAVFVMEAKFVMMDR